jgi:adenosine deaminase
MEITAQGEVEIDPVTAALPKADIHIHQEWSPRLDRVLARREGRPSHDWRRWAADLMRTEAAGEARLNHISMVFPAPLEADTDENFVARIVDLMEEAARDGAWLVEVRLGKDIVKRPDCMALFNEAARQVQVRYPQFHTAAIPFIDATWPPEELERLMRGYLSLANGGLIHGADVFNRPYTTEADWSEAYRIAGQLAETGLGITVHVAEVSPANLAAALKTPGLTRLGHATHAGYCPDLLELVAKSGVTVECALTCNVVLGAAESYETHPIRTFAAAGIPVALCTDDPVQMGTTIGREYAIAHALGFSHAELLGFTRNAIRAAFIPQAARETLLEGLNVFEGNP